MAQVETERIQKGGCSTIPNLILIVVSSVDNAVWYGVWAFLIYFYEGSIMHFYRSRTFRWIYEQMDKIYRRSASLFTFEFNTLFAGLFFTTD